MKKICWIASITLLILLFPLFTVLAESTCQQNACSGIPNDPSHLLELISCLSDANKACKTQHETLSSQINYMNNQINLTTLKINAARMNIDKLSNEINELSDEIAKLENTLNQRLDILVKRVPQSYKRSVIPDFGLLFLSGNISDFITKIKYLSTVQAEDAFILFQVKSTQNNYAQRRQTREDKKTQLEEAKRELEIQNNQLTQQKQDKQALLEQTKNSETIYQQLLAQALAEKQAIDAALISSVTVGPVKKGDPIALVGNSGYPGCSTGPHLHFEVRQNNSWVDPAGYLSSKTVIDDQNGGNWTTGNSSWSWPLQDPIRITQHFGQTPWSWRYTYSGGTHTGYDMVSDSSEVIRAPADGTLYRSSQACGGSTININYIDHGGGVNSFYLHVQ